MTKAWVDRWVGNSTPSTHMHKHKHTHTHTHTHMHTHACTHTHTHTHTHKYTHAHTIFSPEWQGTTIINSITDHKTKILFPQNDKEINICNHGFKKLKY